MSEKKKKKGGHLTLAQGHNGLYVFVSTMHWNGKKKKGKKKKRRSCCVKGNSRPTKVLAKLIVYYIYIYIFF